MDVIHRGRIRIIIVFSALFLVIAALLVLIFKEGKKSYTVTFDLDGGTLISGSLEQTVQQGQDAVPPKAVKDGAYLHSWSGSYQRVTKSTTVRAVWEYETTVGIEYADSSDKNYTEIVGAYKYLQGEVYLGAFHSNKKILGICDEAFMGCEDVTRFYLLDGLISIGDRAFADCLSLTDIEIPETVVRLGAEAFLGCVSLETLTLNEGLAEIGARAFAGCSSLTEIVIPSSVKRIAAEAFLGCEGLTVKMSVTEEDAPEGFELGWDNGVTVEWETASELPDGESSEPTVDGESAA